MSLNVINYRGFALIVEVNPLDHTERTIISTPHMLEEGLFLRRVTEVPTLSNAYYVVDIFLDEQGPEQEPPPPPPRSRRKAKATEPKAIEATLKDGA